MALGGTYQDHYKDIFKDLIGHEAQQNGSRLEQAVKVEMLEGNKTFFDKIGKSTSYTKSSRGEAKQYSNMNFERRQVTETFNSFDHILDKEDLIKYVSDPRGEIITSAAYQLGRDKDTVIINAIKGNAVVTTNGSASNVALGTGQQIAVNNHTFDSGTGDVGLTVGKLKLALTILREGYGVGSNQRVFCVGPSRQLMNLTTENQPISSDFRSKKPLEGPGVIPGLSGFMGVDFIEYEDTGVDGSSDELVYVFTDDAIKLGIFSPLKVEILKDTTLTANPDTISVTEAIGAVRMYEEKVVEIACDPLA